MRVYRPLVRGVSAGSVKRDMLNQLSPHFGSVIPRSVLNGLCLRIESGGKGSLVIFDIVVAIIIVVIAALLGILVHPVLWVIIIAAVLWLFGRSRSRARV